MMSPGEMAGERWVRLYWGGTLKPRASMPMAGSELLRKPNRTDRRETLGVMVVQERGRRRKPLQPSLDDLRPGERAWLVSERAVKPGY